MSDEFGFAGWWFEVRPKESEGKQPHPIDELCSVSSDSSRSSDATAARWWEAFATREASSDLSKVGTFSWRPETRKRHLKPPRASAQRERGKAKLSSSKEARRAPAQCFAQVRNRSSVQRRDEVRRSFFLCGAYRETNPRETHEAPSVRHVGPSSRAVKWHDHVAVVMQTNIGAGTAKTSSTGAVVAMILGLLF